jgi:two-component system, OmpR family, response regulator
MAPSGLSSISSVTEAPLKVLVIDDERDVRDIARLSLARLGSMEVCEAENGQEGVDRAAVERPDAILLDVFMPVMDGPTTLQALRSNPATADIPVIFLTARGGRSGADDLEAMGAAGIVPKPFNPVTLPAQVRAILEGR